MTKLKKTFSDKKWKDCCGSFCKDCKIANAYSDEFGKKEGKKKFLKNYKKQLK